jgi:hypothetical protein
MYLTQQQTPVASACLNTIRSHSQCFFNNMQPLSQNDDAAHSPELGGASQHIAKHSAVHDSTAATAARKPGKSAASKRSQATAPGADEHDYVAPDTAPPLFRRLESQKRSFSSSDSGQSDQGPAKKKRGRPRKSVAAPPAAVTAADKSKEDLDQQEDDEQLPSESPAKKKRGRPAKQKQGEASKAAGATGVLYTQLAALISLAACRNMKEVNMQLLCYAPSCSQLTLLQHAQCNHSRRDAQCKHRCCEVKLLC